MNGRILEINKNNVTVNGVTLTANTAGAQTSGQSERNRRECDRWPFCIFIIFIQQLDINFVIRSKRARPEQRREWKPVMSQSFYESVFHDNSHLFDAARKWQSKLRAEKRLD